MKINIKGHDLAVCFLKAIQIFSAKMYYCRDNHHRHSYERLISFFNSHIIFHSNQCRFEIIMIIFSYDMTHLSTIKISDILKAAMQQNKYLWHKCAYTEISLSKFYQQKNPF